MPRGTRDKLRAYVEAHRDLVRPVWSGSLPRKMADRTLLLRSREDWTQDLTRRVTVETRRFRLCSFDTESAIDGKGRPWDNFRAGQIKLTGCFVPLSAGREDHR